ncbi:hypothetical protein [Streptomyces albipurpureus]|uniref:Uncharacterized protein n=1 Tax=Streptomyces albipurpureus TaxID=2897419 RepID=A0ABT0UZ81_9ACTN|nr:hypothetical protein [Streptomyces sp. CWNU-1]MCM2393576.1 hypothetical protein [Streptomyces sp. CWNU-1]
MQNKFRAIALSVAVAVAFGVAAPAATAMTQALPATAVTSVTHTDAQQVPGPANSYGAVTPENITATEPLVPMNRDDVSASFGYIRPVQARNTDIACVVAEKTGPELRGLLLAVAERIVIPVTALDDRD